MLWSTTTAPTHSALACPSLNILPASVRSAPYSPETCSVCTIRRDTYGRGHHPKDVPYTSVGMLSMRRAQPSRKGLSSPSRRPKVNHRATGRIDRRFDGLERCSSRRGSWLLPRGGFCLARLVKSALWSLLVNRFAILDVKEVNTEIREPIDAPPLSPSAPARTALPRRPKWEKKTPQTTLCQHP